MIRMDTYNSTMAPRFSAALFLRAKQLDEVLGHETDAVRDAAPPDVGDFKDAAAQEAMSNIGGMQAGHAAAEREQVRAALGRITGASYGQCLDCGEAIDLRRLEAVPTAAYCVDCEAVHERGHTERRGTNAPAR